jgi:hypothetical protein
MYQSQIELLKKLIEILSKLVAVGKTITYKELALLLGLPVNDLHRGRHSELTRLLDLLVMICTKREKPLLPMCVVRGDTDLPGDGLGRVLHALNIIHQSDWDDLAKRKQLVKAELQRAQRYYRRTRVDTRSAM